MIFYNSSDAQGRKPIALVRLQPLPNLLHMAELCSRMASVVDCKYCSSMSVAKMAMILLRNMPYFLRVLQFHELKAFHCDCDCMVKSANFALVHPPLYFPSTLLALIHSLFWTSSMDSQLVKPVSLAVCQNWEGSLKITVFTIQRRGSNRVVLNNISPLALLSKSKELLLANFEGRYNPQWPKDAAVSKSDSNLVDDALF